jgi:hypothetical protein
MVSRHENPQEIRPVLKAVDGEGNDSTSIDARQRRMEFRMGFKEPSKKNKVNNKPVNENQRNTINNHPNISTNTFSRSQYQNLPIFSQNDR